MTQPPHPPDASPASVTFVGHSTLLLELGGRRILVDPLLRRSFLHGVRVAPPPPPDTLEGVEGVLVSHLHMDHLDFRSIRELGRETPFVVPKGAGRVVRRRLYRHVTELRPGESTALGPAEIEATEADHDGRRWPIGPRVEALGYLISGSGVRAYFAGDTDLFDGMAELQGRVDVAFLPIGAWGPSVGKGHLDAARAAEAAARIRPRTVIPIHWGTYLRADLAARRPDLISRPPELLREEMASRAPDVEVRVLAPGESATLG